MKTLYIHIGIHKTGTTSLQRFLEINQNNLKKYGFCYPSIRSIYKRYKWSNSPLTNATFLLEPIKSKSFNNSLKKLFITFKKIDNVILSDEMLTRGIAMPNNTWPPKAKAFNNLLYLSNLCEKKHICIKFIIYLRRQDKFIESIFCEEIKSGSTLSIIEAEAKYKNYMNYFKIIKKISSISSEVIIRNYENLVNNDVCEDFLQIFNLNILNFKEVPRENSKLEWDACLLQSVINKLNIDSDFKVYNAYILMTKGFEKVNGYNFLARKEAKELVENYNSCNALLRKKYRIFFDNDYSKYTNNAYFDTQLLSKDISTYINNVFKILNN